MIMYQYLYGAGPGCTVRSCSTGAKNTSLSGKKTCRDQVIVTIILEGSVYLIHPPQEDNGSLIRKRTKCFW